MNKKIEEKERKEAFERLQKRKKHKLEKRRKQSNGKKSLQKEKKTGNRKIRRRRKRSHRFGLTLVALQALVSMVFVGMLQIIGIIPLKYIIIIGILVFIFWGITFATQLNRKGKAIGGKILSMFLIVLMVFGSYYVGKINGAFGKITDANYKIDNMVIAVLKDDPANTLSDTGNYKFGIQNEMGQEDVEKAVENINEKLGKEIETVVYKSVQEQAEALHDGKVEAIIYNEGYTGHLEEAFIGYSRKVKIIDKFKIKKQLTNEMSDTNVQLDPFSVYISGIDVYGDIGTNSRSDVNIIATVNPKTHQILLITTPRDYFVPIPGVTRGKRDKLTHAGIQGVDASMRTLEELYNITIPFYARVNFTSLIDIVDQLGGVDAYSEYSFRTGIESGKVIRVDEGMNHFNGEEALAFTRERYNVPGGDNQRGKNQQALITGLIKKIISPQILVQASGLIDSVSGNVETNMSQEQIQGLIKMQLKKGGGWNIFSVAAEGKGGRDYCYSAPNQLLYVTYPDDASVANIQDLIKRVEQGEILEGSELAE